MSKLTELVIPIPESLPATLDNAPDSPCLRWLEAIFDALRPLANIRGELSNGEGNLLDIFVRCGDDATAYVHEGFSDMDYGGDGKTRAMDTEESGWFVARIFLNTDSDDLGAPVGFFSKDFRPDGQERLIEKFRRVFAHITPHTNPERLAKAIAALRGEA